MSKKAILVVDIPDDYEEYGNGDWYIIGDYLELRYEEDGALMFYKCISDDIVELKPLPEKENEKGYVNEMDYAYAIGFNECLKQILGEEDEQSTTNN